jgi:phosphate transport system permease protein
MTTHSFLPRPQGAAPWALRSKNSVTASLLSSIIPALVSFIIWQTLEVPGAIIILLVFLPLQLIIGGAVALFTQGKHRISDAILGIVILFFVFLVSALLGSLVFSVIKNGMKTLSPQFLSQNNVYITNTTSMEYGGAAHAVLGSIIVVGLATIVTVPLGIAVAVFLTETNSKLTGLVRFVTQAMSGLPSIVAGLFVFTAFVLTGIADRSGWLGSVALMFLMLPTVSRMSEEVLKLVPSDIRLAALALGAPRRAAFMQVILPAAKTGIVTAALLGLARIFGETAPLIVVTNPGDATNLNPFSGPISTLPTYIFRFVSDINQSSQNRAWGAALELLILVGILFALARIIGRKKVK